MELIASVLMAVLAYFCYEIAGFLGVGVLGLLTMFLAFQVDLDKEHPSILLYQIPREPMARSERAARQYEIKSTSRPIFLGKLLGFCLAVVGFGGLWFF